MGLILISDVFTFYMLIASIHALKHLGHRVAPARFFHISKGGDTRLHLPFRSWTVSYWFDYSWTIHGTSVKRLEVGYCSLHSYSLASIPQRVLPARLFHVREGKESIFYLVVSFNMFSSWKYTEEVSNMLLTGNTMWQQFRYGVDIGFRSVYFLHTYCIHSCIVASATLRSTCQVLTRFRQQGSKTPCGFPQLNSDFSIGLFLNNIRNKCKTLWSTILQPPLIHTV